jgi:hypothetical protein
MILGFINCNNAPTKKLPLLFLISCAFDGTNVFIIKYTIYAAPNTFMGSCILGINVYKTVENTKHKIITTKKPANIPRLKTIPLLKPTFFVLFIDIILFGPGVYAIMKIYERNETHGNMITSSMLTIIKFVNTLVNTLRVFKYFTRGVIRKGAPRPLT